MAALLRPWWQQSVWSNSPKCQQMTAARSSSVPCRTVSTALSQRATVPLPGKTSVHYSEVAIYCDIEPVLKRNRPTTSNVIQQQFLRPLKPWNTLQWCLCLCQARAFEGTRPQPLQRKEPTSQVSQSRSTWGLLPRTQPGTGSPPWEGSRQRPWEREGERVPTPLEVKGGGYNFSCIIFFCHKLLSVFFITTFVIDLEWASLVQAQIAWTTWKRKKMPILSLKKSFWLLTLFFWVTLNLLSGFSVPIMHSVERKRIWWCMIRP